MKLSVILISTILLIANCFLTFGQEKPSVHDFRIPRNLERCFILLDNTMTEEEIALIKRLPEDSIAFHNEFKHGAAFFHAWKIYDGSKLTKWFNKNGIFEPPHIEETILITYKYHLLNQPINIEVFAQKYQAIRKANYEIYIRKCQTDSLFGNYIPKDLEDAFIELDKLLSSANRDSIKYLIGRNETGNYHHGLGTWLRNRWSLWGGSRLQQYFLARGLVHPDDMSGVFLEFYHDWLNNRNDDWKRWEKEAFIENQNKEKGKKKKRKK